MFKLKVPATTANMGPGFDTIGMALQLYNEFEVQKISKGIEMIGCENIHLKDNLVLYSMKKVLEEYEYPADGIRIYAKGIDIPMGRGLGSSAASIVAGIMMANQLMDNILTKDDMIRIGTEIEGHPDNIVPAVTGGLTVSIYEGKRVFYSKVMAPKQLRFVAMIPSFAVATHQARQVLPEHYHKTDCIFNISRTAMLIAAMANGEVEKLRIATEDKIHQPYRANLIPEIHNIFNRARELGAMAEVISGSGSTLMAIIDEENVDFEQEMYRYLQTLPGEWRIKVLEIDRDGAQVM